MDKVSNHPFSGKKIIFATKHEKEKILAPIFRELGIQIIAANVDTDALGTFTGEVNRVGTVRHVLRHKIQLAQNIFPEENLFLASEGSFAPHPFLGLIPSNLESLLLYDAKTNAEIYREHLSTEVVHDESDFAPTDDIIKFVERIKFPSHAVIVRPADAYFPIFKGIDHATQLNHAILNSFANSSNGKIIISSDLRSHKNPTRRSVIYQAGKKLFEAINSFCPKCSYPGFIIVNSIPGLPCIDCGAASSVTKDVVYKCASCGFEKIKLRPDGLSSIEAANCEYCNP